MKYLSEEDKQHVAEDYQGPPGASLRFAEARGSDSPNPDLAPCPLCHEPSQPFEDGYWCQNPFCDVRSFRGRTKSVNKESPNGGAKRPPTENL